MDREGVGPDHGDGLRDLVRRQRGAAVLGHQLRGPDVGDQEGGGGRLPRHGVGPGEARVMQRGALASQAHRHPMALRGAGEDRVDLSGGVMASGHRRDDEGRPKAMAQEYGREVDRRQVRDRKGMVDEMDVGPSGSRPAGDVPGGDDPEVLGFAPLDDVGRGRRTPRGRGRLRRHARSPAAAAPRHAHEEAAFRGRPRQRRIRSRWMPN